MGATASKSFPRDFGALEGIFQFAAQFLEASGIGPENAYDVDLILEELFTNLVKYNRPGKNEIEIRLHRQADRVQIVCIDTDVEPFDITRVPEPDLDQPLAMRRAGGLGLHMVREIAESITYDWADRRSTITVTKKIVS